MTFAPSLACTTRIAGRGARSHSASRSCPNGNCSCRGSALRSLARIRLAFGRLCAPCATSCFVGKPPALGALEGDLGPRHVIDPECFPVRVAMPELGQVSLQVGLA